MKRVFTVLLFLICLSPFLFSQQLSDLSPIEMYAEAFPLEKIFLHTDKPHYTLNDTIWVKAYTVLENGDLQTQPSPTVPLYLELLDPKSKEVKEKIVLKLHQGRGSGDIILPENLEPGVYTLRAYSNWSRNFGEEAFYHKDIWIGNREEVLLPALSSPLPELHVDFFPEGGNLVAGFESKVGFKALGEDGLGEAFIGHLIENETDTLASFESNHLGMGSFSFTPKKEANYSVVARSASSDWLSFRFPPVLEEGVSLALDLLSSEDMVSIQVRSTGKYKTKGFHLIGISKGRTVYQTSFELADGNWEIQIDKENFFPGIIQFTLMDDGQVPLAERLVYFHPFAQSRSSFTPDKTSYGPKEYVQMEVLLTDEFDLPISGNFSISVTDAFQVQHDRHVNNIYSHFQLSSEIKGHIEQPFYYFNPENVNAEQDLDVLMLTQGWRKFVWSPSNQLTGSPDYGFEKGLTISGQVASLKRKPEQEPQSLTMMVSGTMGMPEVIEGEVDDDGAFEFSNLNYMDSVAIFLQAYNERQKRSGETVQLKFNEVSFDEIKGPEYQERPVLLDLGREQFIDHAEYLVEISEANNMMEQFLLSQEVELGEVTVRGMRSNRKVDPRTLMYGDKPDHQMEVTHEHFYYRNVYHLLRSRFPGVIVEGDPLDLNKTPVVYIRSGGSRTGDARFSSAQIDGVVVADPEMAALANYGAAMYINGVPATRQTAALIMVQEIERIDVIKNLANLALFGIDGEGGVINILLKGGGPDGFKPTPDPKEGMGNALLLTKGYAPLRQFYTPPKVPEQGSPVNIDYRSTVYWQPYVNIEEDGKANIEFLLTDGSPEIQVELQGVSDLGEPVYAVHKFKVQE
jgi:hypothetical protein